MTTLVVLRCSLRLDPFLLPDEGQVRLSVRDLSREPPRESQVEDDDVNEFKFTIDWTMIVSVLHNSRFPQWSLFIADELCVCENMMPP